MAAHQAHQLKEKGNLLFRDSDYTGAEDLYTQAIQRYSRNPLIFTNRANTRLKLHKYEAAVNDCLKSIEILGPNAQNHKAWYFLAQAQLALNHPNEALASALKAYEQVKTPVSAAAKIGARDLEAFGEFVLRCKKAKFGARERERLRRQGDLCAEVEELLDGRRKREVGEVERRLEEREVGAVEAGERREEIDAAFERKVGDLKAVFAAAGSSGMEKKREIPDYLVDMVTFEVMHDPVMTKNGHSYERATIVEHLKRSPTDPLTREPLTVADLRSNYGLKAACDEFWESGASEWLVDW